MSKKHKTQWDSVPKEQRKKVIRQGILGAFIGFLGLVPKIPKESGTDSKDGATDDEQKK